MQIKRYRKQIYKGINGLRWDFSICFIKLTAECFLRNNNYLRVMGRDMSIKQCLEMNLMHRFWFFQCNKSLVNNLIIKLEFQSCSNFRHIHITLSMRCAQLQNPFQKNHSFKNPFTNKVLFAFYHRIDLHLGSNSSALWALCETVLVCHWCHGKELTQNEIFRWNGKCKYLQAAFITIFRWGTRMQTSWIFTKQRKVPKNIKNC